MYVCVSEVAYNSLSFFFSFLEKDLPSYVQEMHRRKEYLDHQLDELSRQRALCRGGREIQVSEHFFTNGF